MIGLFQIKNLFMSILAIELSDLNIKKILHVVKNIKEVNGRLQLVKTTPNQTKVFIDYAHTPAALDTALKTLKEHYGIKPDIVFGCGGDRDKEKRSKMGNICEKNAGEIYITDDNPRNENPKSIRKMIISGIRKKLIINEIPKRAKAIEAAIVKAKPNSIILIAGKGHETTQSYGSQIINISDKKIVTNINYKKIKFNDLISENEKKIIQIFLQKIDKVSDSDVEKIKAIIDEVILEEKIKFKDFGQPIRIVLTGTKFAPSITDIIQSLGIDEVKRRISLYL